MVSQADSAIASVVGKDSSTVVETLLARTPVRGEGVVLRWWKQRTSWTRTTTAMPGRRRRRRRIPIQAPRSRRAAGDRAVSGLQCNRTTAQATRPPA